MGGGRVRGPASLPAGGLAVPKRAATRRDSTAGQKSSLVLAVAGETNSSTGPPDEFCRVWRGAVRLKLPGPRRSPRSSAWFGADYLEVEVELGRTSFDRLNPKWRGLQGGIRDRDTLPLKRHSQDTD